MTYTIIAEDIRIEYRVKESARAKAIRISVVNDGSVVITKPRRAPLEQVHNFVQRKIVWISRKLCYFKSRTILGSRNRGDYIQHKARALMLVQKRMDHFNVHYCALVRKLSIRNQRTRWGSCSKNGNIAINYRIVHLPPDLIDYVVVHELCHLKELNHSQKFWQVVAQAIPEYRAARRRLKSFML